VRAHWWIIGVLLGGACALSLVSSVPQDIKRKFGVIDVIWNDAHTPIMIMRSSLGEDVQIVDMPPHQNIFSSTFYFMRGIFNKHSIWLGSNITRSDSYFPLGERVNWLCWTINNSYPMVRPNIERFYFGPTTEILGISASNIFPERNYFPSYQFVSGFRGISEVINCNYRRKFSSKISARLGDGEKSLAFHFMKLASHGTQLPFSCEELQYSNNYDDSRQYGDNYCSMRKSTAKFILGCFFLFIGTVSMIFFFYMIDGPPKPACLRWITLVVMLASLYFIAQGTVLALKENWAPWG
jgi:hypothetical protein